MEKEQGDGLKQESCVQPFVLTVDLTWHLGCSPGLDAPSLEDQVLSLKAGLASLATERAELEVQHANHLQEKAVFELGLVMQR